MGVWVRGGEGEGRLRRRRVGGRGVRLGVDRVGVCVVRVVLGLAHRRVGVSLHFLCRRGWGRDVAVCCTIRRFGVRSIVFRIIRLCVRDLVRGVFRAS
jgi:hypothetical protein